MKDCPPLTVVDFTLPFGGDNEWWNIHPAKFPDEHQIGIHGSGSPSKELFK